MIQQLVDGISEAKKTATDIFRVYSLFFKSGQYQPGLQDFEVCLKLESDYELTIDGIEVIKERIHLGNTTALLCSYLLFLEPSRSP